MTRNKDGSSLCDLKRYKDGSRQSGVGGVWREFLNTVAVYSLCVSAEKAVSHCRTFSLLRNGPIGSPEK